MFGLMRPEKKCGKSCHDWTRTHRMHYCGTCKAIGTQYGHQARLFLNFDIVFLSELLSDLNDEKMDEWSDAYQSINRCLSMPNETDKTPFPLQYTATANTILSALKVDDNIKDQKQFRWYATRKFYARSFRKAFEQMEEWGTPKEDFFHWIDLQIEREESVPKEQNDLLDYLSFYAEPTAELTALIFEEGVKKIQAIHQDVFRTLGYNFGLLMYVLDAFEDLENDIFTKQFNPLIHWFNANKTLEQDQLADVRHIILQLQHKVSEGFKALPLKQKSTYNARLVSNIALRIYRERYIPTTRKERLQFRWERAKEFAAQVICAPETNYSMLKYYLVTSSIFLMPRLVNEMPKRADKIDWEWSAFWSMVLPFSVNSSASPNSNQNPKEEDDEKNKKIACCCCFSSLSIFPISQCCISNSVPTRGTPACSSQGSSGKCPLKDDSCNCDCGNCGGCCCDSGSGNRDCRDCCCDGGNSGGCCSNSSGGSSGGGSSSGGDCCCNNGGSSSGGCCCNSSGGSSSGNSGGNGNSGSSGGNGGDGGSSGGGNGGSSGGSDGGSSGSGNNGGSSGGSGGDGCCDGGSGGSGGGDCGCGDCGCGKGGGGGGGGGDCCCGKGGGGGGGGGDCGCGKGGGGGGGGGDCCCGKGGGGGGGGGDCGCGKGGGGGGGGGDCGCGKGGGGGGGGGDCCCGKGGGGGGGGGDCCCGKGGGGGGGGGDCCCGKGGGGGGGGCDCCRTDAGGFDMSAPAHFESCNGVLECFFPWHC